MNEPVTILRAKDVIRILNIAQPTLHRWIQKGLFPRGIKYGPNTTGWPRDVVDRWLAEKQVAASSEQ